MCDINIRTTELISFWRLERTGFWNRTGFISFLGKKKWHWKYRYIYVNRGGNSQLYVSIFLFKRQIYVFPILFYQVQFEGKWHFCVSLFYSLQSSYLDICLTMSVGLLAKSSDWDNECCTIVFTKLKAIL